MRRTSTAFAAGLLLFAGCRSEAQVSTQVSSDWKKAERLAVRVVAEYPHDRGAFTQGLLWDDGRLWESTGQYGQSSLREVDPTTGRVLRQIDVDPGLFAEGLALVEGRLIQLTWQSGLALVWDRETLGPAGHFTYGGQGWGLARDGRRLVMSDGSSRLTFRDANSFAETGSLEVTLDGVPLRNLNELEVVDGWIYANVWKDERIVRIDPETGKVRAVIDASGLLSPMERPGADVLNGIAYDPESKTFWITGKLWPTMFQVEFVDAP